MEHEKDEYQYNSDDKEYTDESNELKSKKLITIGECSKFYLYIIGSALFQFFAIFISGGLEASLGLFGFFPILNSYSIIQSIYTYIGYIIFGILYYIFFKKKKKESKAKPAKQLIYQKKKLETKSLLTYLQIFLVCFCFGLYIEVLNVLYGLGFHLLNYWTFETIFTLLLMKKYFVMDIFTHQKCSIFFVVSTCSSCILIASLIPSSTSEEGEELNTYQVIGKQLGSYSYCFLIIIVFIFLSFVYAYSRTVSKVLMQIKYFSSYKLIFSIGIIGLIISIITALILDKIEIGTSTFQYFSDLHSCEKDYKFYLEIFLIYPIFIFTKFMQMHFEILTIYYLNPIYSLAINNLTYGTSKLISFISDNFNGFSNFIFNELCEIFALIGYSIYLEILELNFCGLNNNLKKNIVIKGEDEFSKMNTIRIEFLSDESAEEENDNNNDNNLFIEMSDETGNNTD